MNTRENAKNYQTNQTYMSNITLWGLLLLVISTIINTSKYGASLSWVILPCILIPTGWIFNAAHHPFKLSSEYFYIFIFWMLFCISTALSDIVNIERDLITFLAFCFVLFCATIYPCSARQLKRIINVYITVAIIVEINVIYNWFSHNYYSTWFRRASFYLMGIHKDPNYVMAYVLPAVAFSFIRLINEKKFISRLFDLIVLAISALAIVATGSRSPMLTFILFFAIYFLMSTTMNAKKKANVIFIGVVIALIFIYLIKKYYPAQALSRLSNTEDPRINLWKSAFNVFKTHPLIGGGMSAATTISRANAGNDSHNVYLDILCNSGIIGSLIFIVYFYVSALKSTKANRAFTYSIVVAFMLPMFFINGFNTATFYTPLILLSLMSKYCSKSNTSYLDFMIKE